MNGIGTSLIIFLLLASDLATAQSCPQSASHLKGFQGLANSVNQICQQASGPSAGQIFSSTCPKAFLIHGGEKKEVMQFPAEVHIGDTVRCEGDGKIEVVFKNNTKLQLFANSEIQLDEFLAQQESNPAKVLLSRFYGIVKLSVDSVKGPQDVRIHATPVSIAVRGTQFEVRRSITNGISEVFVKTTEGKVAVKNSTNGKEQLVSAGFEMRTRDGETMQIQRSSPRP